MSEYQEASGIVSELGATKSNKPKIKIGGHWYMLGRGLKGATPQLGMAIDLRYSTFGDDGTGRNLEAWRQAVNVPAAQAAQAAATAPTDADGLRFISNVIGNACQAGAIKSPTQIHGWFEAAKLALAGKPFMPDKPNPANSEDPRNYDEPNW